MDRKKLILNNKNYLYYKEKKLYLTDIEWKIIEQFKQDLICQVMLEDKKLEHRAKLNVSDAKKISIEIDLFIKDTKILLYLKDIIKIDHIVFKELATLSVKDRKDDDLERYVLERKLSTKIITELENSFTDTFFNSLELSRMKILELLSHEEIDKKDNHILVLGAMLRLLQIMHNLNFEKSEGRIAIIIKDILKERNITIITINKILLNKLSSYKRIIGHEIVEILLKTTCIEQYSFNTKKIRKIFIKILIPTILVTFSPFQSFGATSKRLHQEESIRIGSSPEPFLWKTKILKY